MGDQVPGRLTVHPRVHRRHPELTEDRINAFFGTTTAGLDAEAEQYEAGRWSGGLDHVALGRPRLYDEPLAAISLRLPVSHLEQVDARARGQSRSEYLREVIADTLGQRAAA